MRGFPLLNAIVVVTFFVLAWWPLQQVTGSRPAAADRSPAPAPAALSAEAFTLHITTSQALKELTFSHLDQELFVLDAPGANLEIERRVDQLEIPSEGIEFWVEAEFSQRPGEDQQAAVSIEVVPDDLARAPQTVTLWGRPGESSIGDLAVFLWQSSTP